jgi:hypothetical protein
MALRVEVIFGDKDGCESFHFCGANGFEFDAAIALKPHRILLSDIPFRFISALLTQGRRFLSATTSPGINQQIALGKFWVARNVRNFSSAADSVWGGPAFGSVTLELCATPVTCRKIPIARIDRLGGFCL